jgi:hypothetical protein
MSTTITTTVDIDAPTQPVWDVLTDFATYGEWNPSVEIKGTAEVGTKLVVRMSANGKRGMTFKPKVLAATPGQELRWLGKLGFGGLIDGEHFFILTSNDDGTTRLTHGETFSGVLIALMNRSLKKPGSVEKNQKGYETFSQALKQRVQTLRDTR